MYNEGVSYTDAAFNKKNYHQQTNIYQKYFKRKTMHKTYHKFANRAVLFPWESFSSSLFSHHMKFKCKGSGVALQFNVNSHIKRKF